MLCFWCSHSMGSFGHTWAALQCFQWLVLVHFPTNFLELGHQSLCRCASRLHYKLCCAYSCSDMSLLPPPPKVKEVMFSPLSVCLLLAKIYFRKYGIRLVCLFVCLLVCLFVCLSVSTIEVTVFEISSPIFFCELVIQIVRPSSKLG